MTRPQLPAGESDRPPKEAPAERPKPVRLRLLGGFKVSVGDRPIEEHRWRLRKAAGLVKLLALAPGHRLHRERAMELLWPDVGPKAAANSLHHTLYIARRTLGPGSPGAPGYLRLRDEWLALCPDGPLWVDVEAFEQAAASARRAREPAAYRAALDLYAGDLLPEDPYESWAEGRRVGLREAYLALLAGIADLYEERGQSGAAVEVLQRLVAEEPVREEAHAGLMRLYAANGQRGRALEQYGLLRDALRRELGTEPGAATELLYREIRAGRVVGPEAASPEKRADAPRHNLPIERTSFVGRERELLELKRDLAMTRLLTLTGAGGSGKTRLALEVARDLLWAYPGGVWFAELAPLSDPALVPRAVASALSVREQPDRPLTDTLADALREKEILLLLDNCEHLVDGAARLVDTLLDASPTLRVLATSREPLGVAGEINRPVPPLSLPDPRETPTVEKLEGSGSVRLFVERALYRPSTFVLTPQNARAVAEICRQLEGIPLAIELAAARVGALAVEQISERLADSMKLLTGGHRTAAPRQRTLKGSLDWSHELLEEPERSLFRRLSVFAGGWTLEAAEAVGAEPAAGGGIQEGEVLDLISRLVDKSLVVARVLPGGALRYGMLEPVRQYAREKLQESLEAGKMRRRHAGYYVALAVRAAPELKGPRQLPWLEGLDGEQDDLRAAMRWLLEEGELETAARLGWALWLFWWIRGLFAEGRRWMEEALAAGGTAMPATARARALFVAGTMACGQAEYRSAAWLLEESLALFRELEDERGAAYALSSAGFAAIGRGQHERGIAILEEAVDLSLKVGERWGAAFMLCFLATVRRQAGDRGHAKRLAERGLALSRETGDRQGISAALYILATLAHASGELERAGGLFGEALRLSAEMGDETHVAYCLEGLAAVAGARGDVARAARLWGAAEVLLEKIEAAAYVYAPDPSLHRSRVAAARAALDEETFALEWATGGAMSHEEAIGYALAEEGASTTPPEGPPGSKQPATLTRREEEVAALAARGLTNRRIAGELSISEHTAATHVRRVLGKLNLASRAQLAAWTVERSQRPRPGQDRKC